MISHRKTLKGAENTDPALIDMNIISPLNLSYLKLTHVSISAGSVFNSIKEFEDIAPQIYERYP